MTSLSRRRWFVSATIASLVGGASLAEGPRTELAAAARLPVTSRTIRLKNDRETPVVVTAVAVDPRGELVAAAGDDFGIRILHAATLEHLNIVRGHRDLVRTMTFDPNGDFLVSAGNDGQLIVWDRGSDFQIKRKWVGTPALACVSCAPRGGELAAVGFQQEIYILGRQGKSLPRLKCDCNDLRAVAYRDDMQVLAVAGRSGDLYLFQPQSGELLGRHPLHDGRIHAITFLPQSNLIVCVGDDGQASVFDTGDQRLAHRVDVTTSKLFAVTAVHPELVAVAGSDNLIRVVHTGRGKVVRVLKGHHGSISTLQSDGDWLFSGSYDATLRRWAASDLTGSGQRIAEGDQRIDR